ncbi:MAG: sulfatase-like hydrolase/transferase [Myxococcales bacterium]|nr:sulfatase-like hydrolase/transferase [Myxococcales bacterium]
MHARRTWLLGALGIIGLATAGAVALWPGTPAPTTPPNVLVVLWDTVRADRMSLYGHERATTPALEAFAEQALVFDQATAPGTWTLPTHATMLTGLYPTTHGARAGYRWLDHHHRTLPEILGDAGYDTFWFSSNLIAGPLTNLTQGVATLRTTYPRKGERGPQVEAAKRATLGKLLPDDASNELGPAFAGSADDHWPKAAFKDAAPVIVEGFLRWLDRRDDSSAPFFAYLNLMEAHTPRVPSRSARQRLLDDDTLALGLATDVSLRAENEFMIGQRDYTEAELEAIRGVYDAALLDLDDATAELFDALTQRGVLDDTLVVLVSDHGEHLGEHQRFEHRWSIHQQLLHVPLVVRLPGARRTGRVSRRVSTADVFSTVLDVVGIAEPLGTQTRTLLASDEGPATVFAQLLDPYASQLRNVAEVYGDLGDYAQLLRTYCAVFEDSHKVVHASDGATQLFDLATDPGEHTDRAAEQPDRVKRLLGALSAWEQQLPVYDPAQRIGRDRRGKAGGQDRSELQMLQALGYVGDDDDDDYSRTHCSPSTNAEHSHE